jgi:hypothetical protein
MYKRGSGQKGRKYADYVKVYVCVRWCLTVGYEAECVTSVLVK